MTKVRAVGIDLGTTYSAMACVNEQGQSVLFPNSEGDLLTPSVVLFDDDQILVGKEAKKVGVFESERFAECAKRDIGRPFYSKSILGRQLPPEVIQAFVLRKLREDLVREMGENFRAVITVPAFFDEPRRKATVDAATMAGINVLDIVNEPTAAALAFGEDLGYLKPGASGQEKIYILIYDLGGGTFDVTLIELQSGELRTLATDGDVRLGGRDWDGCIVDWLASKFMQQFGTDPRSDLVSEQRLYGAVEEAKHTLSARQSATVRVQHAGNVGDYKITREDFEDETLHLLERTAYVTRQLLTASGMHWTDLSRILLVGGSTRMPMVAQMLEERTGIVPDHSVNPDEAVARGAALYAQYLLDKQDDNVAPAFTVTNVNSHSLGIEGIDPKTGRKCNNIIIPRNTPLPARKTEKFSTRQVGQSSVVLKVLEGESPVPTECTMIGRTVIRDMPKDLPAGTRIYVTYRYETNGRLSVHAKVKGTDKEGALELERDNTLSKDVVQQWTEMVVSGQGFSSFAQLTKPEDQVPPPSTSSPRMARMSTTPGRDLSMVPEPMSPVGTGVRPRPLPPGISSSNEEVSSLNAPGAAAASSRTPLFAWWMLPGLIALILLIAFVIIRLNQ